MSTCCYVFYSFRVTVVNKDVSIYLYFSVISVFVTLYYLNLLSHFLFGHLSVFSFTLFYSVMHSNTIHVLGKACFSFEILPGTCSSTWNCWVEGSDRFE